MACRHPERAQIWLLCEDNGEGDCVLKWCAKCRALWSRDGVKSGTPLLTLLPGWNPKPTRTPQRKRVKR